MEAASATRSVTRRAHRTSRWPSCKRSRKSALTGAKVGRAAPSWGLKSLDGKTYRPKITKGRSFS